jgi:inhibitor of KinA sporulation pathway (predicted exonuclease)
MDLTKVLCIDIETTMWRRAKDKPVNHCPEIIEIGVALVDTSNASIIESASIIVKPSKSKVSEFCTKITKLKQQDVDAGISLEDACRLLRVNFMCQDRPWMVWGNFDKKILQICCKKNEVEYPLSTNYTNYKNLFCMMHGLKDLKLSDALKLCKLNSFKRTTCGIDTAMNIANLFVSNVEKLKC